MNQRPKDNRETLQSSALPAELLSESEDYHLVFIKYFFAELIFNIIDNFKLIYSYISFYHSNCSYTKGWFLFPNDDSSKYFWIREFLNTHGLISFYLNCYTIIRTDCFTIFLYYISILRIILAINFAYPCCRLVWTNVYDNSCTFQNRNIQIQSHCFHNKSFAHWNWIFKRRKNISMSDSLEIGFFNKF